MATRCTIAIENTDGSVDQVYCHWDGYLEGVGAQLVKDYTNPVKLMELIALGDMSKIGEPYTQRGEDLNISRYQNVNEYFAKCQQAEYDYILRKIDREWVWYVRCEITDENWDAYDEIIIGIKLSGEIISETNNPF